MEHIARRLCCIRRSDIGKRHTRPAHSRGIVEPPRIQTRRLNIRGLTPDDSESIYSYRSLPEVYRYQNWVPKSATEVGQYITRINACGYNVVDTWFQLCLCLQSNSELIGDLGLHFLPPDNEQTEIGFTVSHQGMGYAHEAVTAVMAHLFHHMNKHRIVASVDPNNSASISLLEKLGMRKEGLFKKSIRIRGVWEDDILYAILKEEWQRGRPEDSADDR
jgi:RimJ/RimL family protein N-acetyltransferase